MSDLRPGQSVRRDGGVTRDGQRGRVVQMDDGGLGVRLDRTAENLVVPLTDRNALEWVPDLRSALQPMQMARVAYGADRELRIARGEYGAKEWMNLNERERLAWMQAGPADKDPDRAALYLAVMTALKGQ